MKTIITISIIILFYCSPSYCQFQKEADYSKGSINRILLQNQSERYFNFDDVNMEIKIADASHQIINSIPTPPCDGDFSIRTARSDFDNIDLGVLCSCSSSTQQNGSFILDQDGNVVKQFINAQRMDDRYIIDFDEENFNTYIYDTRSLELIDEMPQIELRYGSKTYNDEDYYYGNNTGDSIFIFDSSLSKIRDIDFDFIDKDKIRLTLASIMEDNEPSFYLLASEFNEYRKLIDENGTILHEFPSNFPLFHKYGQKLQVVHFLNQGVLSYDVNEQELFEVVPTTSSSSSIRSSGKYISTVYNPNTTITEFYNYKRELDIVVGLYDSNYQSGPFPFTDHLGNEYFWYRQEIGLTFNVVIFKELEYLQTIDDTDFIDTRSIEGLTTKIISYPMDDSHIEVYGLEVTNTKDVSKSTFSISPNPVNDALTISGDGVYEKYTIYDGSGKVVQTRFIQDSEFKIDVSHLSLGMYFIKMNKKDKTFEVKKFIKT